MRQTDETQRHIPSPLRLFLRVLTIVFLSEGAVMLLLPVLLGDQHKLIEPVVDGALLIVLSSPFLWWSVVRPLRHAALGEHARAATIVAHARDGIITINDESGVESFNPAAERIFGYKAEEIVGRPVVLLVAEPCRDALTRGLGDTRATGGSLNSGKAIELDGLRKDCREFPMELSVATWEARDGTFHAAIVRDITERKQADEQLRATLDQLKYKVRETQALSQIGTEILALHDLDRVLRSVVEKARELLGIDAVALCLATPGEEKLLVRAISGPPDAFRSGGSPATSVTVAQALADEKSACAFIQPEYRRAHLAAPVRRGSSLIGIICVGSREPRSFMPADTDRLVGLATLAAIAIQNARLYEDVRSLATVEERERIAREMHDGLAQALALLYLKLQQARQKVAGGQAAHAAQDLRETTTLAEQAYEEVRQSIFGLRTMVSRGLGLVPGLTEYLHEFSVQSGIPVELDVSDGQAITIPPESEVQLVRIVQEALANVRKHAEANRARVRLDRKAPWVQVTVEDDGRGFDPAILTRPSRSHFGLQTMRERAEGLGGNLEIDTAPGRGTRVVATLPAEA